MIAAASRLVQPCLLAALITTAILPQAVLGDALSDGFADPPPSARPRVWWHWMNGNVTKDGIAKDLDWMKKIGIGGLQNFDVALQTPQIVEKRLVYMTPEWKDAFRFAVARADSLGLEMAIASSPGWSETGGPWVKPKDALKKLVWSETLVQGGKRFTGVLPPPPSVVGPFQGAVFHDPLQAVEGMESEAQSGFYADAVVLAYPESSVATPPALPRIATGSGKALDGALLTDDSLETAVDAERGTAEKPGVVTLSYPNARTIRSATLFIPGALPPFGDPPLTPVLEAGDGAGWRKLAELPLSNVPTTVSFAPVSAREFRIVFGPFTGARRPPLGAGSPGAVTPNIFGAPRADAPIKVAELRLSEEPKIDRFEVKAGFSIARDYYELSNPASADDVGVAPEKVVDLTSLMKADGTLDWTPPPGAWRVLRLGYSLTGKTNHPAPPEATGLEVDKYDAEAVRNYLQTYLGMYRDAAGSAMVGARGVQALLTDSTEVGASNWTPRLVDQFKRLRGYDPTAWLPALTGVVVGSRARSDAFLYDFRRTLSDLHASEHYGTVAAVAHENGLKVYGEALEDQRPTFGDDMAMRQYTDVPMAAMWAYGDEGPRPTLLADMKGASSVAHLYGQNLAAAESMTSANSPWAFAPADLRRVVDLEFAYGINRPVIHTSVHQPVDDKVPGLSLMIFGQYFNRHEAWAEMAKSWIDYLARTSYLLQQGRNFADVAYFYGEEAPLTALYGIKPIEDAPVRYAYDFVNADVLINRLSVDGGDLVAKSGARYRLLYLGGSSSRMTLAVLRRIAELAEAGATIVGGAPFAAPRLKDDKAGFDLLVRRLWNGQPSTKVGRGRVIRGRDVEAALASIGVTPDFAYAPQSDSEVLFLHRRLDDGDVYFVDNRRNRPERFEARFCTAGKAAEIWRADTGSVEPLSYRTEQGVTVVPLDMLPEDSFFVVFRKPGGASAAIAQPAWRPIANIGAGWDVAFQPDRGAPAFVRLETLTSLSENAQPGIKYFSGTAAYTRSFALPTGWVPGAPLLLDLGKVGDVAEVRVNGQAVGTVWHAPYRLDIGQAGRAGDNQLEVRVANLWVNRLIGDAQPNAQKITFVAAPTYLPDAPLRPAGLLGPVTLFVIDSK